MLTEGNKPVLYRYQAFLWTFIGIGIYLSLFFSQISLAAPSFGLLNKVTDIDLSIVTITALSQGAYLGGKFVARTPVQINGVYLRKSDRVITVFGDNFLTKDNPAGKAVDKGIIFINGRQVPPVESDNWQDNRIDFTLADDMELKKEDKVKIVTSEGIPAVYTYCGNDSISIKTTPPPTTTPPPKPKPTPTPTS